MAITTSEIQAAANKGMISLEKALARGIREGVVNDMRSDEITIDPKSLNPVITSRWIKGQRQSSFYAKYEDGPDGKVNIGRFRPDIGATMAKRAAVKITEGKLAFINACLHYLSDKLSEEVSLSLYERVIKPELKSPGIPSKEKMPHSCEKESGIPKFYTAYNGKLERISIGEEPSLAITTCRICRKKQLYRIS